MKWDRPVCIKERLYCHKEHVLITLDIRKKGQKVGLLFFVTLFLKRSVAQFSISFWSPPFILKVCWPICVGSHGCWCVLGAYDGGGGSSRALLLLPAYFLLHTIFTSCGIVSIDLWFPRQYYQITALQRVFLGGLLLWFLTILPSICVPSQMCNALLMSTCVKKEKKTFLKKSQKRNNGNWSLMRGKLVLLLKKVSLNYSRTCNFVTLYRPVLHSGLFCTFLVHKTF